MNFQSKLCLRHKESKMYQYESKIPKFIFIAWLRLCQFFGLIIVNLNPGTKQFEQRKLLSIVCIVFGCFISVVVVYATFELFNVLQEKFNGIEFTIRMSYVNQIFMLLFVVTSHQQQFKNRKKICETLNNSLAFLKNLYEDFENSSESISKKIMKCEILFFISTFIKSFKFLQSFAALIILSGKNFKIIFFSLSYQFIVALAIYNQFFLGVISTQFVLSNINDQISRLHDNTKFRGQKDEHIKLKLERISVMHTKIFEFMRDLSEIFGFQVSFGLFINIFNITISAFQITSTTMLLCIESNDKVDYGKLYVIGFVNMSVIVFDLLFYLNLCILCMNEVSFDLLKKKCEKNISADFYHCVTIEIFKENQKLCLKRQIIRRLFPKCYS